MKMERLRRDSFLMGVTLGIVVPGVLFALLYGILLLIFQLTGRLDTMSVFSVVEPQKLILLSIIPSVFLLRYYLLKLKFDQTGRGILAVTFLIAIGFAVLEFL